MPRNNKDFSESYKSAQGELFAVASPGLSAGAKTKVRGAFTHNLVENNTFNSAHQTVAEVEEAVRRANDILPDDGKTMGDAISGDALARVRAGKAPKFSKK